MVIGKKRKTTQNKKNNIVYIMFCVTKTNNRNVTCTQKTYMYIKVYIYFTKEMFQPQK